MDLNKFMQAFGLLFVAIGTVVGLGFAVSGVVAGMGSLVFMGVCFLVLFCGIGGFFAWTGISNMNRERKINEKGYAVMGKIFDYVPDNQMTLNGQPTLSLIVRYKEDGFIRQAVVRTGQGKPRWYPEVYQMSGFRMRRIFLTRILIRRRSILRSELHALPAERC